MRGNGVGIRLGKVCLVFLLISTVFGGYSGVRVGEATNPGPYVYGGASSSGSGRVGGLECSAVASDREDVHGSHEKQDGARKWRRTGERGDRWEPAEVVERWANAASEKAAGATGPAAAITQDGSTALLGEDVGAGCAHEAWWDEHGMSVGESWAMMNAAISDGDGVGIEPEERARLWKEFEELQQSHACKGGGEHVGADIQDFGR